MAFEWTNVTLTVTDRDRKLAKVVGTIADGEDVRVFTLHGVNMDAKPMRPLATIRREVIAALTRRFDRDVAARAKEAALQTTLTGWEASLLTGLNEALGE